MNPQNTPSNVKRFNSTDSKYTKAEMVTKRGRTVRESADPVSGQIASETSTGTGRVSSACDLLPLLLVYVHALRETIPTEHTPIFSSG